jgi:hypothetical protein
MSAEPESEDSGEIDEAYKEHRDNVWDALVMDSFARWKQNPTIERRGHQTNQASQPCRSTLSTLKNDPAPVAFRSAGKKC